MMSQLLIICFAIVVVAFEVSNVEAQITISTAGPVTTATESPVTTATEGSETTATEAVAGGSTESETVAAGTGSTLVDDVTATTQEVTTYIDETAIFCRQYLLNNTNWEPFPTYADNGAGAMRTGMVSLVGMVIARIVAAL